MIKRVLFLFALSCLPAFGACSNTSLGTGINCVVSHQNSNAATSITNTYSSGHTAGDVVVAMGEANIAGNLANGDLANTNLYTWNTISTGVSNGTQAIFAWCATVPTTVGTPDVLTLTKAGAGFTILISFEASGITCTKDGTGAASTTGTGSGSFSFGTTSLPLGFAVGSATLTNGSGWTTIDTIASFSVLEYITPGGTSANAIFGGASYTCALGVALTASGGSTPKRLRGAVIQG